RWAPVARRAALVCATSRFYHRLVNVAFCRRSNLDRALDAHPQISDFLSAVSFPLRGAYRDRHGRWVRDAVDAAASRAPMAVAGRVPMDFRERCAGAQTNEAEADGKTVWS